jgi:hypothetical protein
MGDYYYYSKQDSTMATNFDFRIQTRQDKLSQDNRRQDKATEDNTRQSKATQDKTIQDKQR